MINTTNFSNISEAIDEIEAAILGGNASCNLDNDIVYSFNLNDSQQQAVPQQTERWLGLMPRKSADDRFPIDGTALHQFLSIDNDTAESFSDWFYCATTYGFKLGDSYRIINSNYGKEYQLTLHMARFLCAVSNSMCAADLLQYLNTVPDPKPKQNEADKQALNNSLAETTATIPEVAYVKTSDILQRLADIEREKESLIVQLGYRGLI